MPKSRIIQGAELIGKPPGTKASPASSETAAAEKTAAKAEIWTDAAGFTAAGAAHETALAAIKAATDDASFKTAFVGFGGSCKGCHEKFRAAE